MIDFSNLGYKYIGNHQEEDDTNNYKYDANKAKQMLADKRYNDLADYLRQKGANISSTNIIECRDYSPKQLLLD